MSKKRLKYQLVKAATLIALENEVRVLILDGWKPQGGVAVSVHLQSMSKDRFPDSYEGRNDEWFYQAMVNHPTASCGALSADRVKHEPIITYPECPECGGRWMHIGACNMGVS